MIKYFVYKMDNKFLIHVIEELGNKVSFTTYSLHNGKGA